MKKITLYVLLLSSCIKLCAMQQQPVKLPTKTELNNRLEVIGLDGFVKTTQFTAILGGKQKYPCEIVALYDQASQSYLAQNPQIGIGYKSPELMTRYMHASKPDALKIILQDYPTAIASLKADGTLK